MLNHAQNPRLLPRKFVAWVALATMVFTVGVSDGIAQNRQNRQNRGGSNPQGDQFRRNPDFNRGRGFGWGKHGWNRRRPGRRPTQPTPTPPPRQPTPARRSYIDFDQRGAYLADFTVRYEENVNGRWTPRVRNLYNIAVNSRQRVILPANIRNVRVIGEAYVFIGTKGTIFDRTYAVFPLRQGSRVVPGLLFTTTGTTLDRNFRVSLPSIPSVQRVRR